MYYIENPVTDAAYNLALEEFFCQQRDRSFFILWRNAPAVIVGRYQNTLAEVNLPYCEQKQIAVVRRNSGGGTVFHDLGNLNFSFLLDHDDRQKPDFAPFAERIAAALRAMGLSAQISGRNDIEICGRKVSGNAQFLHQGRLLHHGTLLFDVDMEQLAHTLAVDPEKIHSKGVASVRARVQNIHALLPDGGRMDVLAFRDALAAAFAAVQPGGLQRYVPNAEEQEAIRQLAEEKYRSWEWNFGASPQADCSFHHRFPAGKVEIAIKLSAGRIAEFHMTGDFFADAALTPFLDGFHGLPFTREALAGYLQTQVIPLRGIGAAELLYCCFEAQ